MQAGLIAEDRDFELIGRAVARDAEPTRDSSAQKTRNAVAELHLDAAAQHASFSMQLLQARMQVRERGAEPLLNGVRHSPFEEDTGIAVAAGIDRFSRAIFRRNARNASASAACRILIVELCAGVLMQ